MESLQTTQVNSTFRERFFASLDLPSGQRETPIFFFSFKVHFGAFLIYQLVTQLVYTTRSDCRLKEWAFTVPLYTR